jgi:hypothetical protein
MFECILLCLLVRRWAIVPIKAFVSIRGLEYRGQDDTRFAFEIVAESWYGFG